MSPGNKGMDNINSLTPKPGQTGQTKLEYNNETHEITVVVGVRAGPGQSQRLRNARAVLWALNLQTLRRWYYRIVVVEQDSVPRLKKSLELLCDHYIFAYNPGPYNRGWAFNIGAAQVQGKTSALCFLDADLLVPPDFLSRGLHEIKAGHLAVSPYSEVVYLDPAAVAQAIEDRLGLSECFVNDCNYEGTVFTTSQGGAVWVEPDLYFEIGGHNEDFRGWGFEDREFWRRLERKTNIKRLPGRLLHLHHPQQEMQNSYAIANQKLYQELSLNTSQKPSYPLGDLKRYTSEAARFNAGANKPIPGMRDWENWHGWTKSRIEDIVYQEERQNARDSARYQLVQRLVLLGNTILDIGCGPGAMWLYLEQYQPKASWVGLDITYNMLKTARYFFPQVPVIHADAGNLPFVDNSFDVIVIRHVLEHLPGWLMALVLEEAMRAASKNIVLVFYVPPLFQGSRKERRVGENFLETQWTVKDIETIIVKKDWRLLVYFNIPGQEKDNDTVWLLMPAKRDNASTFEKEFKVASASDQLKISIIMPTYKRSHSIYRTIETICRQRHSNWELIIIDNDGGDCYKFEDSRIRVYIHNSRVSASYARNQGLQYVNGDLVCFFDDDDEMFPDYLERFAIAFHHNPGAKMVRCGMILPGGQINFSYATPECCLRRKFAAPTWTNIDQTQDQHYFQQIISLNSWSEESGDIIVINKALCKANTDKNGGLRSGNL